MEERQRQKKIASVLQRDLVDILRQMVSRGGQQGVLISVSKVRVTVDMSLAKVYLSIFPSCHTEGLLTDIRSNTALIKHELAQRTKHQLRRMPALAFFVDDSLDYIDGITTSLRKGEDPIKDSGILEKRKKL